MKSEEECSYDRAAEHNFIESCPSFFSFLDDSIYQNYVICLSLFFKRVIHTFAT